MTDHRRASDFWSARPVARRGELVARIDQPSPRRQPLRAAVDAPRRGGHCGEAARPAPWSSSAAATQSCTRRRTDSAPSCPRRRPMTLDTIFDLASLTKVVATTTRRDAAGRAGTHPPERSGGELHSRLRALRQAGHHDAASADARLRTAAGRRSRRSVGRLRHRDRAGARGSAHRRRRASASSTATSTSSCSATSSRA